MINTLTNWSYKKIKMYRACPMSVRLKYIDRVAEPDPDPKYDKKRQRGIMYHDVLEGIVNTGFDEREGDIGEDVRELARSLHEQGATAERDEYFDSGWKPMKPEFSSKGYPLNHWLVVKKDYRLLTDDYLLVGDWKTGKKEGNEVDHFEQMRLYALTEWLQFPGFNTYDVELQYIDQDETWSHSFTVPKLERALKDFDGDVQVMMKDTWFRPKPSKFTCQYCPYGPRRGNGACPVGV